MASEWPVMTLQDVCETITDGSHLSPKNYPGGLPMASVKDMARWGIDVKTSRTISREDFDDLVRNGCQPQIGDVLIAKDGATCLDTVCEFRQPNKIVLLSSVAILRPSKQLYSGYLRYYLDCADTRAMLKAGYVSGSAIPRVVLKDFRRAPIPLPSISEQKAIANILGTMDDKIELNRRMNATLETMAQTLFKSWFVDFDPVRAKLEGRKPAGLDSATAALFPSTFQDSPLGQIPKGWTIKPVGEVVDCVGGGTPSTAEPKYWEGGTHHWTTPKDFSSLQAPILLDTGWRITDAGVAKISSGLLPVGTLLLSSRAPVGYLAIATIPVAINQGFIAMKCNERASNYFMLNWCQANMTEIESRATGTTFAEISKKSFRPIQVVLPTKEVMAAFTAKVAPLYARITANLHQSRTLATLRDTLLPKLLSGELRIDQAELVKLTL